MKTVTYDQASRWSWGITVLCACYIAWVCYVIKTRIPALAQLYAGLGGELPRATQFTIELSNGPVYVFGAILILCLALKESLLKNVIARFSSTIIVFMVVAWLCDFTIDAMLRPMFGILDRIR